MACTPSATAPGAVAGPGAAGGTGGRAVGEEVQQRRGPGEQPAADGEAAEGDGVQVPDDGGVDQQVQRLGRQDDERRDARARGTDGGILGSWSCRPSAERRTLVRLH